MSQRCRLCDERRLKRPKCILHGLAGVDFRVVLDQFLCECGQSLLYSFAGVPSSPLGVHVQGPLVFDGAHVFSLNVPRHPALDRRSCIRLNNYPDRNAELLTGAEQKFGEFSFQAPPRQGLPVDPSGVTADGKKFAGIREFKQHLFEQKEQVARNFIAQLVVYATGGEIEFADHEEIEAILKQTRTGDFPVRDIIHEVVRSKLFRHK